MAENKPAQAGTVSGATLNALDKAAKADQATPAAPAPAKLVPGATAGRFKVALIQEGPVVSPVVQEYVEALDASFQNGSVWLEIEVPSEKEADAELKLIRQAQKARTGRKAPLENYAVRTRKLKPVSAGKPWTVRFLAKSKNDSYTGVELAGK